MALSLPEGLTGNTLADTRYSLDPVARILPGHAFDYFVTITGAKTENLAVLTESGLELLWAGSGWPMRQIRAEGGPIAVPDMLVR